MKRKDVYVIAVVGIIAAVVSIIISSSLFGSPKKNVIKVPVVNKISSEFPSPQTDSTYQAFFNNKAIDPTQLIQIGNSTNTAPFQTGQSQ